MNIEKPKIIVAIPCYNEEKFIGDLVKRASLHADMVLVVDDGSTDNTAAVAQAAGAVIKKHGRQKGAGAATKSSFQAAIEYDCDILVTMDGDAQHNPDEIPLVIEPILLGKASLVIGSRFLQQAEIRKSRKFGIQVITWLYNFGHSGKITDSQCCFRAHSRNLVENIKITDSGFGYSIEVLVQARKRGFDITEVPVSCIYHSEGSTMNPIPHGFGVAFSVIKHRIKELN